MDSVVSWDGYGLFNGRTVLNSLCIWSVVFHRERLGWESLDDGNPRRVELGFKPCPSAPTFLALSHPSAQPTSPHHSLSCPAPASQPTSPLPAQPPPQHLSPPRPIIPCPAPPRSIPPHLVLPCPCVEPTWPQPSLPCRTAPPSPPSLVPPCSTPPPERPFLSS